MAFAWPRSGNSTTQDVRDGFGPRTFTGHIASLGYNYDFHRGCDLPIDFGDPVYSLCHGPIIRLSETHYGWDRAAQLTRWVETDAAGSVVFSHTGSSLRITGSRPGAQTFAEAGKFRHALERVDISTDDWEIRIKPTGNQTVTGGVVGVGFEDQLGTERVTIEYDGTTLTARGAHAAGVMGADGTAVTVTPKQYRIRYTQSTDTIVWEYTSDDPVTTATNWTNLATQAAPAFTREGWPAFTPVPYWRATASTAGDQTFDLDHVGWYDAGNIPRFGNWISIVNGDRRVSQMHMQEMAVSLGDVVEAGQLIGYSGNEGFDARSGPVLFAHCHVEYATGVGYHYDNSQPINPLAPGLLPRANVSNNVAVVRTTANDPDGVDCWRLTITTTRADQDFDMNQISLTGSSATRTLNFDTRAGLNADTDIPKQSGVYLVCTAFSDDDATMVLDAYFSKAVVGATFTSAFVKDTEGTTLWAG